MERRDALKLLAGAAALPLLSSDVRAIFQDVHRQLPAIPALKLFNSHQNAVVTTLAELIIPQTDTPGAKAARVNEFIDLVVAEWYDEQERTRFLAGLANVDARSHGLFAKDFIDCEPKQQTEIVKALDEELAESRQTSDAFPRRRRTDPPENNFFFMIKHLTLVGYFTSQIGAEQALHFEVIPSGHSGCAAIEEGVPGEQ
jgi:glucoside 3-dehydrogenase (cytochrome c) hitch-hiker subunit